MRTFTLIAGIVATTALSAQEAPRFEAVSIRHNTDVSVTMNNRFTPGRMVLINYSPSVLIQQAYGVTADRLLSLPEWATRERFDIEATYTPPELPYAERMRMLQPVLAERFGLEAHGETRELPVYALVRIRADALGPGLLPSTLDCTPQKDATGKPVFNPECRYGGTLNSISGNVEWTTLNLPLQIGIRDRPVIDRTGLRGRFDIDLRWLPEGQPDDGTRVSIFTALQEQLGLQLESTTAPLEVLVIDRISRPTPN